MPEAPVYAAAKAGVINFALSVAPSLERRGIRVCALCPQVVDTPMANFHLDSTPQPLLITSVFAELIWSKVLSEAACVRSTACTLKGSVWMLGE